MVHLVMSNMSYGSELLDILLHPLLHMRLPTRRRPRQTGADQTAGTSVSAGLTGPAPERSLEVPMSATVPQGHVVGQTP